METKKFAEKHAGEFAEKHAGEYFLFRNRKVRVAGYYAKNGHSILVSVPKRAGFGWGKGIMDCDDVLVVPSRASNFWYVNENDLEK